MPGRALGCGKGSSVGSTRSWRRAAVRSRLCPRRQRSIARWSPPRRTLGGFAPAVRSGASVVGIFDPPFSAERLVRRALGVAENPGDQPHRGVDDDHRGDLTPGQDIIADREQLGFEDLEDPLVEPFVTTAQAGSTAPRPPAPERDPGRAGGPRGSGRSTAPASPPGRGPLRPPRRSAGPSGPSPAHRRTGDHRPDDASPRPSRVGSRGGRRPSPARSPGSRCFRSRSRRTERGNRVRTSTRSAGSAIGPGLSASGGVSG